MTKKFHRLEPVDAGDPAAAVGEPTLTGPSGFITTLARGDGIVVASWDEFHDVGRVHGLGIVENVDKARSVATVDWRRANFTVNPSPQGRTQWLNRTYFKFADKPAERYRLTEYFDDAFAVTAELVSPSEFVAPTVAAAKAGAAPTVESPTVPSPPATRAHPPRRNRVAPDGEIIVTPARGTFMGNRAYGNRWLVCELEFERDLKEPRKYEKLFFLDEAVALAAGHRPCNTCRRRRLDAYLGALQRSIDINGVPALDSALSAARSGVRPRASADSLPDGAFIALGPKDFRLVWRGRLHRWTPDGYEDSVPIAPADAVDATVLTPAPSVEALRHGYQVVVHPSVAND